MRDVLERIGPKTGWAYSTVKTMLERLVDLAAQKTGIDRLELRRRNFVRPAEMPYRTALDFVYDSGDFPRLFDEALQRADHAGLEARRRASNAKGLRRGFGVSCYLHGTGGVADENSRIELGADGGITVFTGTQSSGQGHETIYAQVAARLLDMPVAAVRVARACGYPNSRRSCTKSHTACTRVHPGLMRPKRSQAIWLRRSVSQ